MTTQPHRPTPSPRVPEGSRVYAVGDVHGRVDLLDEMFRLIERDAQGSQAARKVIVMLGDYLDRGPDAQGVMERLLAGPPAGFHLVPLKGNHEQFLLDFLADPEVLELWLWNGGRVTLASYGVEGYAEAARRALTDALPPAHLAFLEALPCRHVEGDYAFVHAGIQPGIALEDQSEFDLLWIRHPFLGSMADFGHVIVHGHSITPEPEVRSNRIGIDTGAYMTGRLTALALEGDRHWFLHT